MHEIHNSSRQNEMRKAVNDCIVAEMTKFKSSNQNSSLVCVAFDIFKLFEVQRKYQSNINTWQ